MSSYNAYQEDVHRINVPGSYYESTSMPASHGTSTTQKPPALMDRIGKREISSKSSMILSAILLVAGLYCYPFLLLNSLFLKSHNGAARVFAGCSLCLFMVFLGVLCMAFVYPIVAGAILGGVFGSRPQTA